MTGGIKRTADGQAKTATPATEEETPYKIQHIRKLMSNIDVYTKNIVQVSGNVEKLPERAHFYISYEGQKLAVAVKMLTNMLNR